VAISLEELQLAARNHGMPLEALRHPVTPVGLHYLLIHYDIPFVEADSWSLSVDGAVERPLQLSLDELRRRETVEVAVTMECAGNGRALLDPHVVSQPWLRDAVGTARWRGVPVRALLAEARPVADAVEVLFTGADRGIEGDVEQQYARSLPIAEALRDETLLAYEMNHAPLLAQHGFPLRLVVPGWYGMTNVKWLERITVLDRPFDGYQHSVAYRMRFGDEEEGEPVTRMLPRSLIAPPGIPDFATRDRTAPRGPSTVEGQAWSGLAPIERVEVSVDGGRSWNDAELAPDSLGRWAWRGWTYLWEPDVPGEYTIGARAHDADGNVQPDEASWNVGGYANNAVQWVRVTVA
jgi:DMSO/TMAO reductase YedYZ molybdopterin-dependent catalytic subunit